MPQIVLFFLPLLIERVLCTTEWFGDLRAHLNPPSLPPFYDIVYDESECPFGLESIAIPEYVYFGEMIATKSVREHSACLQFCLETPRCKAVNFFESLGAKKADGLGFCELLVETQYDNPRLMRPFRKATYYEKIHCRAVEEEELPFEFDSNGKEGKELLLPQNGHSKGDKAENGERRGSAGNAAGGNSEKATLTTPSQSVNAEKEKETALKKLAQKVQEFNLRFRS